MPKTEAVELVKTGSQLPEESGPLPPEVRQGILGEDYKRKNRGRSERLSIEGPARVDLVESIGDDQLAQQVTITCQVFQTVGVDAANLNDIPAVVGFLSFGNDGFQSDAEIDFVNGAQITCAGAFVRFAAAIDLDAPNNGGENMPEVRVGAHLGVLPSATVPAHRTRYFALTEAGGATPTQTLPIPPFAERAEVLRTGSAAILVEVLDRSGAVIVSTSSAFEIEARLPNDARFIRVTNLTASAISGRIVHQLWL